jgi:Na+-transporting NADH:ubiquinone oxidoreductase subunit NqrB
MKTKNSSKKVPNPLSLRQRTAQSFPLAPALVAALLVAFCPAQMRGDIVFNTLNPRGCDTDGTYDQTLFFQLIATGNTFGRIAAQFTAMASGDLSRVDLGLTRRDPLGGVPAGPVNVFLFGDANGSPDSANQTPLGLSGTPTVLSGTTNSSLLMVSVAGNVPVTMGSTYWLVLEVTGTSPIRDNWMFSEPAVTGSVAGSSNQQPAWIVRTGLTLPAFRIITGAVPTPDSGWTLLLMLGSVAALLVVQGVLRNERSI